MAHHGRRHHSGGERVIIVLVVLAVYRVSLIICIDEGPFSLFQRLRDKIDPQQEKWYGRGLRCVVCVSFWLALLAALIIGGGVLEWLAIAGAVAIIHKALTR